MNKMTIALGKKFNRTVPKADPTLDTYTTWLYVAEVQTKFVVLCGSYEDAIDYGVAKAGKGNRLPRYYALPLAAIKLVAEHRLRGAVCVSVPLQLALNKRMVRLPGEHSHKRAA